MVCSILNNSNPLREKNYVQLIAQRHKIGFISSCSFFINYNFLGVLKMKLYAPIKIETVLELLVLCYEMEVLPIQVIRKLEQSTNYDIPETLEIELFTCSIQARNGLNKDAENYILSVLKCFKETL
jgi:hypothetical protein